MLFCLTTLVEKKFKLLSFLKQTQIQAYTKRVLPQMMSTTVCLYIYMYPTKFQQLVVHESVWYYSILLELSSGIIVKVYIQVHMNKTVQVWIVTLTLTFHLDYQTVLLYRCCIVSVVHYRS